MPSSLLPYISMVAGRDRLGCRGLSGSRLHWVKRRVELREGHCPMSIHVPTPAVRLEDIIITDRLNARAAPPPDYAAENAALHRLAREIARDPDTALQAL